jgi:cytochrome b
VEWIAMQFLIHTSLQVPWNMQVGYEPLGAVVVVSVLAVLVVVVY